MKVTLDPKNTISFIKFNAGENKLVIAKNAKTEYVGPVVIKVTLEAYTTDRIPKLRSSDSYLLLDIKSSWTPPSGTADKKKDGSF